jgi:flagellar motor switch protein FliN
MADDLPPGAAAPSPDPSTPPPDVGPGAAAQAPSNLDASSIEELLKQASFDDPATLHPPGGPGMQADDGGPPIPDLDDFKLPSFQQVIQDAQASSIELLRDVELNVKIELGRSRMLVEDVLKLAEGSVVELDKLAGDPVDVFVNDRLVARGEVLVLNDNFCVRVNEIVAGVKEEGL